MPDMYILVGLIFGAVAIFRGRRLNIKARADGDMESIIPITLFTVFVAMLFVVAWPVIIGLVVLAWIVGLFTIPEAKAFIKKNLRD